MSLAIDREEFVDATSERLQRAPPTGCSRPASRATSTTTDCSLEQDLDAAAAMIAEYEEETGTDVEFALGHIPSNVVVQGAELLMGWWSEIGIDVDDQTIPQNDFINLAVFGVRRVRGVLCGASTPACSSTSSTCGGTPRTPSPTVSCRSTSGACATRTSTPPSTPHAPSTTDEEAIAAAEEVNRIFAEQCYYIPLNWLPWAVLSDPEVHGVGELVLPDGSDGTRRQPIAGQFWMQTLYVDEELSASST